MAADAPPQTRPPTSWLDTAQRNTQRNEMDGKNTSSMFFWLFTIIQPPVVALLAAWWGVPQSTALFPIAAHALGSLVSQVTGDAMFFDVLGEVAITIDFVWSYYCMKAPTTRQRLLTVMAFIWVARLGGFLTWRICVRGWDWRFAKLMDSFAYNMFCFVCQGTWIFLQVACVIGAHSVDSSTDSGPIGLVDYVGVAITLGGITIAQISDMQKSVFNKDTTSDKQSTWIQSGLWRYSRHPNYFGEMLSWVGLGLICWGSLPWTMRPLCILSPVWSWFFLVFTSLSLLEKRLDKKFGGQPVYEDYKQNVSCLLPWPYGWGWTGPKPLKSS